MTRPVPTLVAVGVGEHADAVALFERILQQPLESAPVGVHLDSALDAPVVRDLDVGVTAADVREHDAILVLQGLEEVGRAVGVGLHVAEVLHQGVVGAVDLAAFRRLNITLRSPPSPVLPDHS